MQICKACYKKLYHQRFTPYDYYSDHGRRYLSTCCDAEVLQFHGSQYHKVVRGLEEKKGMQAWTVEAFEGEGARA
ncbi:MAG: hypothetical protein GY832_26025 [Chloroflexi bacterium]|nr:hypothetical protein [Chloroflexota bacterium]